MDRDETTKEYGSIGSDICRIQPWSDGTHFDLCPVAGGMAHVGLREGEFRRYSDSENQAMQRLLGIKTMAGKPVNIFVQ